MMRSIKSQGGLTRGRGMSESVRTLWTSTLHHCASVHETMLSITNTVRRSSEQHKELGTARCTRDASDLRVLCDWLQRFDPFDIGDQRLRSLSSGLAASDNDMINCDDAESVGQAIHQKLDNVAVSKASIPSSMTVKSLVKLSKAIHVHNEAVHIDPTVLFMRLVVLVERYEDTSRFFHYELTPVPTSLFKDGLMRHPNKAALAQALTSGQERGTKRKRNTSNEDVDTNEMAEEDITESEKSSYVLDGGALLHRVRWNSTTFREVLQQYQRYVASRYGKCLIVFDGYQERTIKDHEHLRRQQKGQHCPDIVVTENTEVHHSREEFLSNECNKQQLIALVVKCLKEDGHTVEQCQGDADGTIVDAALGIARSGRQVTVVADDTDVLVLLLYFYSSEMATVFMRSEPKGQQNVKLVNIGRIADTLKVDVRQNLLFIHAWTGCDTTSATFNQGKTSILRLLEQGKRSVLEVCAVFDDSDATQEQIVVAGTKLFVIMYGGRDRDSLGHLRRVKFTEMSLKSRKGLQPEMLPPTDGAAKQHSLRVFLQVTLWKTLMSSTIDPTKWGWNVGKDGSLEPIMTEEDPAPEEILNVVRCKCKNASKNQCGTALCSCRKNGLSCVSACGECNGVGCNNGFNDVVASEEEEDFDAIDDGNIFDKLF